MTEEMEKMGIGKQFADFDQICKIKNLRKGVSSIKLRGVSGSACATSPTNSFKGAQSVYKNSLKKKRNTHIVTSLDQ